MLAVETTESHSDNLGTAVQKEGAGLHSSLTSETPPDHLVTVKSFGASVFSAIKWE